LYLEHDGGPGDTAAGRRKYLENLGRLAADAPAHKAQRFAETTKGWIVGTRGFAKELMNENRQLTGHGQRLATTTNYKVRVRFLPGSGSFPGGSA
jgi:hypothetical protein